MTSGRKIYRGLPNPGDTERAMRALDNGSLRSLAHYLSAPEFANGTWPEHVLGLAIVEGFRRWLHKGKGKLL